MNSRSDDSRLRSRELIHLGKVKEAIDLLTREISENAKAVHHCERALSRSWLK